MRDSPAPEAKRESGRAPVRKGGLVSTLPFSGALVRPICTQGCQSDMDRAGPAVSRPVVSGASVLSLGRGSYASRARCPSSSRTCRSSASASDATSPFPSPTVHKPVLETRQSERLNLRPLLPGPWSPDTEPPLLEQLPVTAGKGWCAAPLSDLGGELVGSAPGQEGEASGLW